MKTKKESTRKLKYLLFTLSMPNPPSWNGRWSGEGNFYGIIRAFRGEVGYSNFNKILNGKYYSYRWSDGWCASIEVCEIDRSDLPKIRKKIKGFCGYDWMVSSIIQYGEILSDYDIKQIREKELAIEGANN